MAKLKSTPAKQKSKGERELLIKKLKKAIKKLDLSRIFEEAAQKSSLEAEAYRHAQAKSKGTACNIVFY
jgi:hypothetical protein